MLTGTARVDVRWAARADTGGLDLVVGGPDNDVTSNAGSMSVTLGDLADSTGDPLAYTGTITGAGDTPAEGYEIAEIVFDGMQIEVGLPGGHSGHLIVGAETAVTPATDPATYTYSELTLTAGDQVRYRLREIGLSDTPGSGTASISALFVGQGVDGPLGVLGTFTLDDENVARVNATGLAVEDNTAATRTIRGGFGADIP